eukprot:5071813-Amphidinium_carterae.1
MQPLVQKPKDTDRLSHKRPTKVLSSGLVHSMSNCPKVGHHNIGFLVTLEVLKGDPTFVDGLS